MKITCDMISDLLPLYIDEVCTEDSKKAVDEHLLKCAKCKSKWKLMSSENVLYAPERSELEKAKKPFKKLRVKFIFWLIFVIFCSCVVFFTLNIAGAFSTIEAALYHSESFIVENAAVTDDWTPITQYVYHDGYEKSNFETENYLELRGAFRKKKLDCSFPFEYKVTLRILDENGDIVVEPFEANGGMLRIPLKQLKSGVKYYVEYTTETGGNFAFTLL